MRNLFKDRREGGVALSSKLAAYAGRPDVMVLGLPRGGVPVAYEVGRALKVPVDVLVVRKLGVPGYEEVALGAIASGGARVLNEDLIQKLGIRGDVVSAITAMARRELERREAAYRGDRSFADVRDRVVILVDDGIATGASMTVAVEALRLEGPRRIVVAAPVATHAACAQLRQVADECVCVLQPQNLYSVGAWYVDFSPTSDGEVRDLLRWARHRASSASATAAPSA